MKLTKKVLALLISVMMVISLLACGETESGSQGNNVNISANSQGSTENNTQAGNDNSATQGGNQTQGAQSGTQSSSSQNGTTNTSTTTGGIMLTGLVKMPADGIGTPGVDFVIPEKGEVTGWDEFAAPAFNPLGSYEKYSYASQHGKRNSIEVSFLADDNVTLISSYIYGETYSLSAGGENITRNWLLYEAREMGATIFPTNPDMVTFFFESGNNEAWWVCGTVRGDASYGKMELKLVKINYIKPGASETFKYDSDIWDDNRAYFYTAVDPGNLQSLGLEFNSEWDNPERGIYLKASGSEVYGDYDFYYHYCPGQDEFLSARFAKSFSFDNVPMTGLPVCWEVNKEYLESGDAFTISLENVAPVETVKYGEELGLVKITGASGNIGAELSSTWFSWSHPEAANDAERAAFLDEDGNYCFAVPSGWYDLSLGCDSIGRNVLTYLRLIPVSAGMVTTVSIPQEFSTSYSELIAKYSTFDTDKGNMEILGVKDMGDKAEAYVLIHDPEERDLYPSNEDFEIYENGVKAKVLSVDRQPAGVNVVLCIDTSGSMKSSMKAAISAAQRFVESLPDNTNITVIGFETKVTVYETKSKTEAIEKIGKFNANGGTSLYDATSKALGILEGKDNPYIVVFADGADSSEPGVSGTGSKKSLDTVLGEAEASEATILTIGFGKDHDPRALKSLSNVGGRGAYFVAANDSELDNAFAAVAAKFGNQFVVTYERPLISEDVNSDVPVVSLMIDKSGSMHMDPSESDGDVDYRIDKVKKIFHNFILNLPDKTLVQTSTFAQGDTTTSTPTMEQITTTDKARTLSALSTIDAYGGTPTTEALELSYTELSTITSSKRVLVFFTDAALAVEDDGSGAQQQEFEEALKKFKDANIRVLFAGLGGEEYAKQHKDVFAYAAEIAGGDYIITSDVTEIEKKLNELLEKVNEPMPKTPGITFMAGLNAKASDGSLISFSASKNIEQMIAKTKEGSVLLPGTVEVDYTGKYIRYDSQGAALLYGAESDSEETTIMNRISFENMGGSNEFADMQVKDAFFMSSFKGLDNGNVILGLNVAVTFHKKDKSAKETGYEVPSVFNHFYVSCNNEKMVPASKATWLCETPLVVPGESGFTVNELYGEDKKPLEIGETREGMLIFLLDMSDSCYGGWKQLSLHFYDTAYDHIEIAMVGSLPEKLKDITALPKEGALKVSDNYKLSLVGMEDSTAVAGYELTDYYQDSELVTNFRTLEMEFESNVQALLNINPKERFYYGIETDSGVLMTKMSNVVYNMPLGFTGSTYLAPGSTSKVRLPYEVPEKLLDYKAELVSELSDGIETAPIKDGKTWDSGTKGQTFEHEYFTITINELAFTDDRRDTVALDFTVTDKKDGEGTGGFDTVLMLRRDDSAYSTANTSEGGNGGTIIDYVGSKGLGNFGDMSDMLRPLGVCMASISSTQELIFGASYEDADWGAYDGQSRRGVLIFEAGYDDFGDDWRLECDLIPSMSVPISKKTFSNKALLSEKVDVDIDNRFNEELDAKCNAAVTKYRATHPGSVSEKEIGLTDDEIIGNHIPTAYLTTYGTSVLESVKTLADFENVMNSLTWMGYEDCDVRYSPEAVITQGFGNDREFYYLAQNMLTRLGYRTTEKKFCANSTGIENLERLGNYEFTNSDSVNLWAIAYTDAAGNSRIYVPAFRHYADELYGLGYVATKDASIYSHEVNVTLKVTASGTMTEAASIAASMAMMNDIGSLLGGAEEVTAGMYDTVTLLEAEINLAEVGKDFMDISFVSVGKDEDGIHDKITAVCDSAAGLLTSPTLWVNSKDYVFDRIDIVISGLGERYTHTLMLEENESLLDIFQTVALGTPELTKEAAAAYEKAVSENAALTSVVDATNYGTARWYTHATLAKLINALGNAANDISTEMGIVAKRLETPVMLVSTLRSDGVNATGSVDLTHISMDIALTQKSYEENKDINMLERAFNASYGMLASEIEGTVLYAGKGISYLDVWAALPENAGFITIDSNYEERMQYAALFEAMEFPKYLIDCLKDENRYCYGYTVPTAYSVIDGKKYFAWLETNVETMETVSVFSTGERSGMAAYLIGLTPKSAVEFTAGALIGITCSTVSVSAYALMTEDYGEIMENAGNLMVYTYNMMAKFQGMVDDWKDFVKDPVGKTGDMLNEAYKDRTGLDVKELFESYEMAKALVDGGEVNLALEQKEPTFLDGFKAVIEAYFGIEVE